MCATYYRQYLGRTTPAATQPRSHSRSFEALSTYFSDRRRILPYSFLREGVLQHTLYTLDFDHTVHSRIGEYPSWHVLPNKGSLKCMRLDRVRSHSWLKRCSFYPSVPVHA